MYPDPNADLDPDDFLAGDYLERPEGQSAADEEDEEGEGEAGAGELAAGGEQRADNRAEAKVRSPGRVFLWGHVLDNIQQHCCNIPASKPHRR